MADSSQLPIRASQLGAPTTDSTAIDIMPAAASTTSTSTTSSTSRPSTNSGGYDAAHDHASVDGSLLQEAAAAAVAADTAAANSEGHNPQSERRDRKVMAAVTALAAQKLSLPRTNSALHRRTSSGAASEIGGGGGLGGGALEEGEEAEEEDGLVGGVTVEWQNLSYSVPVKGAKKWPWSSEDKESSLYRRKVMMNMSGKAGPGDLVAIMGPEGSGKTLLLRMLAGRMQFDPYCSGQITYNKSPFPAWLHAGVGYVDQHARLLPHLSVKETLMYAARLRLPQDTEDIDAIVRVEHVLDLLELVHCADSIIDQGRVLSNERRRLAIGVQMVVNPPLLLLDEPTLGLDGAMALRITRALNSYAQAGRTVIATMKQPSQRMFKLFSHLLLTAEGNPIYFGRAEAALPYFAKLGLTPAPGSSPSEFFLDLTAPEAPDASVHFGTTTRLIREWKNISWKDVAGDEEGQLKEGKSLSLGKQYEGKRWSTSWWFQVRVLLSRSLTSARVTSDGIIMGLAALFVLLLSALLLGCLWFDTPNNTAEGIRDTAGFLFFAQLFWGFIPMLTTVLIFLQDRECLRMEQDDGVYHISAFFFAQTLFYLPFEILPPILFSAIVYWMVGLNSSFGAFVLFALSLALDCLIASSIGMAISTAANTPKQAIWGASFFQMLSVAVINFLNLRPPSWIKWVRYLSFSNYIQSLLVIINFPTDGQYYCGPGKTELCSFNDSHELEDHVGGIGGANGWVEAVILLVMLLLWRLLALACLKWRLTRWRWRQVAMSLPMKESHNRGP